MSAYLAVEHKHIEVCATCGGGGSVWPENEPLLRLCPTCRGTGYPAHHPATRKAFGKS